MSGLRILKMNGPRMSGEHSPWRFRHFLSPLDLFLAFHETEVAETNVSRAIKNNLQNFAGSDRI